MDVDGSNTLVPAQVQCAHTTAHDDKSWLRFMGSCMQRGLKMPANLLQTGHNAYLGGLRFRVDTWNMAIWLRPCFLPRAVHVLRETTNAVSQRNQSRGKLLV